MKRFLVASAIFAVLVMIQACEIPVLDTVITEPGSEPDPTEPGPEPVAEEQRLDADVIASFSNTDALDAEYGVPFAINTFDGDDEDVFEVRSYDLASGNILNVTFSTKLMGVTGIVVTFIEPFATSREAIEACGFDFDALTLITDEGLIVTYTGKTDNHDWLSIEAFSTDDGLWEACAMEVKP